jgi:hypothetical protein
VPTHSDKPNRSRSNSITWRYEPCTIRTTPSTKRRTQASLTRGKGSTSDGAVGSANARSTAWRASSRCARTNLRLVPCRWARRVTRSAPDSAATPIRLREEAHNARAWEWAMGEVAERDLVAKPDSVVKRLVPTPFARTRPRLIDPRSRSRKWNPALNHATFAQCPTAMITATSHEVRIRGMSAGALAASMPRQASPKLQLAADGSWATA